MMQRIFSRVAVVAARNAMSSAPVAARLVTAVRTMATTKPVPIGKKGAPPAPVSVEKELAETLKAELKEELATHEQQGMAKPSPPPSWTIEESQTDMRVTMTRTRGSEKTVIKFVVPPAHEMGSFGGANVDGEGEGENQGEEGEEGQQEEGEGQQEQGGVPFFMAIVKPSGALTVQGLATHNSCSLGTVMFSADSKTALDTTQNASFDRAHQYQGPALDDLPSELQAQFRDYLEEAGLTDEVVAYIFGFSAFKESNEYHNWLNKVSKFLISK